MPYIKTVGRISSTLLSQDNRFGALGAYELEIEIDYDLLAVDPDKFGYLKTCIATHLAGCCTETGLPLGEGIWKVSLHSWVLKHFPQLPPEFIA